MTASLIIDKSDLSGHRMAEYALLINVLLPIAIIRHEWMSIKTGCYEDAAQLFDAIYILW